MMFQNFKYFTARLWVSTILSLTLGYTVLYILHETALPDAQFDDTTVQWALLGVSIFFGFFAFGLIGEQKFHNLLHFIKTTQRSAEPSAIISLYERLIDFSRSACFLSTKGKKLRDQATWNYAEYLLSIGHDDDRAVQIYLTAFLQAPDRSKFRAPLLALFARKNDLSSKELDLLLVMLRAENFEDDYLVQYLAKIFLQQKLFNEKTEPLFIKALQKQSALTEEIVRFALPQLIGLKRFDESAIKFYAASLPYLQDDENEIRNALAKKYCEGIWAGMDPNFHRLCGEVFSQLDAESQNKIRDEIEDGRLTGKLRKVKLFSNEDLKQLEKLKKKLGITRSPLDEIKKAILYPFRQFSRLTKFLVLKFADLLIVFSRQGIRFKLATLFILLIGIVFGVSLSEFSTQKEQLKPELKIPQKPKVSTISNKVHTIQVAAGTSKKQAQRLLNSLKKKGLQSVYLVTTPRKTGGTWYKVRVGEFATEEEARQFAKNLITKKTIKSYFIISQKKD
ncbi:MAG: hypothetical protein COV66_10995 [Nitrospinae bacterium CG11_big_fil_rev_8_21_14_0_20_45_15]|nr:MAG: hypothetical protein COV66_10995 [Nitrospinae bacterium CG11_big_fil_rev_8_21_14_0_20_45_15]